MALIRRPSADEHASADLPPARMYLDDVEELVRYLEEYVGPVTIRAESATAEVVSDLLEIGCERLTRIDIEATNSDRSAGNLRVEIRFAPWGSAVTSNMGDPTAKGIVYGVAEMITRHRRMLLGIPIQLLQRIPWWVSLAPWVALLIMTFVPFHVDNTTVYTVEVLMFIPVLLSLLSIKDESRILLSYRKDSPSFWKRKGDDILVGLVVGIVLAAVGFFAGIAVERAHGIKEVGATSAPTSPARPSSPSGHK